MEPPEIVGVFGGACSVRYEKRSMSLTYSTITEARKGEIRIPALHLRKMENPLAERVMA
jgi:hypothetical protein